MAHTTRQGVRGGRFGRSFCAAGGGSCDSTAIGINAAIANGTASRSTRVIIRSPYSARVAAIRFGSSRSSFGGWTWSGGFGAAAGNAASFANSCYNFVNGIGTAQPWGGTFDGIDIDWEYPNSCGLTCDSSGFASYKTLMVALRSRFGSQRVLTPLNVRNRAAS